MQYKAIIKDGGLFIPNILGDLQHVGVDSISMQLTLNIKNLHNQPYLTDEGQALPTVKINVHDITDGQPTKFNLGQHKIKAFDSIADPVQWQNDIRDAW
ncbi:hypothetical protein [Psychrobacter lutiphocae]|uniref:hypothetical protein n=1 Tax=Psychrobacter lutiphocae TaxID=540500 RepID=UPI000368DE08|nr:hypothetical protein [Psychrobacter lutiphocae]